MSIAITDEKPSTTPQTMSLDKTVDLLKNEGLQLTTVIDGIIELNGFVGVGMITLADMARDHIYKRLREQGQATNGLQQLN